MRPEDLPFIKVPVNFRLGTIPGSKANGPFCHGKILGLNTAKPSHHLNRFDLSGPRDSLTNRFDLSGPRDSLVDQAMVGDILAYLIVNQLFSKFLWGFYTNLSEGCDNCMSVGMGDTPIFFPILAFMKFASTRLNNLKK